MSHRGIATPLMALEENRPLKKQEVIISGLVIPLSASPGILTLISEPPELPIVVSELALTGFF